MKTLLLCCILTFLSVQSKGQNKEICNQYYSFKSTCYFIHTEYESAILTLYKDSSFLFEVFLNQYGNEGNYSRSGYTGLWTIDKEFLILNYLDRGVESIAAKTYETVFSPTKFVLYVMPVKCKIENENLITDSKVLPKMNTGESKVLALVEKWRFENCMLAKRNRKVKFNTLSIDDIRRN